MLGSDAYARACCTAAAPLGAFRNTLTSAEFWPGLTLRTEPWTHLAGRACEQRVPFGAGSLADSGAALTDERWAEVFGDGEQCDDEENTEHIDFENLAAEIEETVQPLPGVPIRILSATQAPDCPAEWDCALVIEKSIEFQEQWLQLSPDAVQVLVEGGHNLHEDNPQAVTAEILTALEESRP